MAFEFGMALNVLEVERLVLGKRERQCLVCLCDWATRHHGNTVGIWAPGRVQWYTLVPSQAILTTLMVIAEDLRRVPHPLL